MRITQLALISIVGFICLSQTLGHYPPKPWPTYSLENMPQTDFTCHGKILGGYYADPETQCQMFHVCVKLAGVGVKDFRFLCPNGTAFDQEAQICADWGDVDCEQATLYYSSDNFDLYRLGSGFESKRAPIAEDEQPFHLQNAESNDIRRVPHQNPSFNRNNVVNYNGDSYSNKQSFGNSRNVAKVRPTTTTTTTTTEASYQVERRGDDEIFKGSHSSNFFNNRNNGKEDDLVDFPQKTQSFQRNHNHRGRRPQNNFRNSFTNSQNNNIQPFPTKASEFPTEQTTPSTTIKTTTTTIKTTYAPQTTTTKAAQNPVPFLQGSIKTVSLQSSFRAEESSNNDNNGREFFSSSTENIPFQRNNYQQTNGYYKTTTQQRIQPTTYSPPLSSFSGDSSSPKYEEFRRFDKGSTTSELKFKQAAHNSFYNAQFENKATESYDQAREQTFQNSPAAFAANNRSVEAVNDVVRPTPKTNSRGYSEQNSFNARQNEFNERPTFAARPNSFSDRSSTYPERRNTFNERPHDTDLGHGLGEKSEDNFDRQQLKPQTSQRPSRYRGTKIFNRAELNGEVSNPLNVRPLEIQTHQTSSTPAPNKYDQIDFNVFTNNYRQSTQISSTPLPNRYEHNNNYNGFNDNFRPSARNWQSTTPNTYTSPSAFGFPEVNRVAPSPFSAPIDQQVKQGPSANITQQQTPFQTLPTFDESPRGFSLNPPYQNQSPIQARASSTTPRSHNNPQKYDEQSFDNYTPATQVKKFSTLVPKDQFYPTTFKPATYKKVILGYDQKLGTSTKYAAASYLPTTTTTTTTSRPQSNNQDIRVDEDDGQYHPELYEKDFVRNKFKASKQQVSRQNFDFDRRSSEPYSDTEDEEFLNTAHSLNIAAGANQLRAEKFKESNPKVYRGPATSYTSAPAAVSNTVTTSTTTRKPIAPSPKSKPSSKSAKKAHKGANEDASYDYAYYDSFSGNPQDYEYDLISEFGKTRKN